VALDLRRRATDPELLDLGVPEEEVRRSLGDLRFVNRWLGGMRGLQALLEPLFPPGMSGRLLDVGSGSGDLPTLVERRFPGVRAVAADVKWLHLVLAPTGLARVVADVRALPFAPGSFDVVTASLFLHHFDEPEAARVLAALWPLARRALVVNDLRRARVPYLFGRLAFPLLFRSRVSVEDGLVSIRRGFTEGELRATFADAGLPQVAIRRAFPYRLLAVARRS
jgi:SAM-dependent methyltransferase